MPFDPEKYEQAHAVTVHHYCRLVHELKLRRERLGISQQQMADWMELTVKDIQDFESLEETHQKFLWVLMYISLLGGKFDLSGIPGEPSEPILPLEGANWTIEKIVASDRGAYDEASREKLSDLLRAGFPGGAAEFLAGSSQG
ncbi:MAG TPA: hypothetical protein VLA04_03155 [Verrucomicrobiae bacterium]|nr:hypothetical protein [Verrucomicrobiae bacterium]